MLRGVLPHVSFYCFIIFICLPFLSVSFQGTRPVILCSRLTRTTWFFPTRLSISYHDSYVVLWVGYAPSSPGGMRWTRLVRSTHEVLFSYVGYLIVFRPLYCVSISCIYGFSSCYSVIDFCGVFQASRGGRRKKGTPRRPETQEVSKARI